MNDDKHIIIHKIITDGASLRVVTNAATVNLDAESFEIRFDNGLTVSMSPDDDSGVEVRVGETGRGLDREIEAMHVHLDERLVPSHITDRIAALDADPRLPEEAL